MDFVNLQVSDRQQKQWLRCILTIEYSPTWGNHSQKQNSIISLMLAKTGINYQLIIYCSLKILFFLIY